jgi:hypothetical protein
MYFINEKYSKSGNKREELKRLKLDHKNSQ